MIKKNLDQIGRSDIDNLLTSKVPEGIQLDYKQKFNRNAQDVAKDLSAMANTEGGDYILGVIEARDENNEKLGYPEKIEGIDWTEEQLKQFVETSVMPRIEPRLPTLGYRQVEGYEQGSVFVIRVPKSRTYPHLAFDQHKISFAKRGPYGNYWLDSKDMRHAIIHGSNVTEQVRALIADRIDVNKKIATGANGRARMLFHVFGTTALEGLHQIEWEALKGSRNELQPLEFIFELPYASVDGFITSARTNPDENITRLIVSREGHTELITTFFSRKKIVGNTSHRLIVLKYSIEHIVKHVSAMGRLFKTLGIGTPYYASMTLLDCQEAYLSEVFGEWYDAPKMQFGREVIQSPIIELTDDASDEAQVRADLRPIYEYMAQAGGKTVSDYFDQYGQVREN